MDLVVTRALKFNKAHTTFCPIYYCEYYTFILCPNRQSWLGYGNSASISIELDDEETRTKVPVVLEDDTKQYQHLFYDGDNISG